MKRFTFASDTAEPGVDINLAPLIDVVFLLLIFFIVSAVFVNDSGVAIDRPTATAVTPMDRDALRIAITRDGRILYERREITLDSLRAVVAHRLSLRPAPVVIEADTDTRTGLFMQVHDACTLAGAAQVFAATQQGAP